MGFCPPYTAPSDVGNVLPCTNATRPTGASLYEGRVIFETDTNTLAVYVDGAWQGVPQTAGFRNAIINGGFDIAQRGRTPSVTSGTHHLDQWQCYWDGTGTNIIESIPAYSGAGWGPAGLLAKYYCRYRNNAVGTGSTFRYMMQALESVQTFNGQTVTLSFMSQGSYSFTGTMKILVTQYFGSGGSPSATTQPLSTTFTVTDGVPVRQKFTFAMPTITGKTFGTDGKDCLTIRFSPNDPNAAFAFDVSEVQLELGSAATPFERRPYGTELALCQRYFYRTPTAPYGPITQFGYGAAAASMGVTRPFPVPMRVAPSATSGGAWTLTNCTNNAPFTHIDGFFHYVSVTALGSYNIQSANSGYYDFSAEL